jgi:hypothetical protein
MYDEQKPDEYRLKPELTALERQLRDLTPAAPRVDRDRLMFVAGQAAAGTRPEWPGYVAGPSWPRRWLWPAAAAAMAAASVLLATMLVWQIQANRAAAVAESKIIPQASDRAVAKQNGLAADVGAVAVHDLSPARPPLSSGYLNARYIALTRGVGDWSTQFDSSNTDRARPAVDRRSEPSTVRELRDELLRSPARIMPSSS